MFPIATYEDATTIKNQFLKFNLGDKVAAPAGDNVRTKVESTVKECVLYPREKRGNEIEVDGRRLIVHRHLGKKFIYYK